MHEHVGCMIMHVWMLLNAWWLAICRQNSTGTDKSLEYWARNGSCSDIYLQKVPLLGVPSFEDTSRPSLKAGSCKIVEKDSLNGIAACWNSHVKALGIASVVNAFLHVCFFIFFSFLFSSSHFCLDRPFRFSTHRGIVFFCCPCFLLELPLKVVNPSGCSFFA